MQIISYSFIILKHIQLTISKVIDAKSPIVIFFGDNLYLNYVRIVGVKVNIVAVL